VYECPSAEVMQKDRRLESVYSGFNRESNAFE